MLDSPLLQSFVNAQPHRRYRGVGVTFRLDAAKHAVCRLHFTSRYQICNSPKSRLDCGAIKLWKRLITECTLQFVGELGNTGIAACVGFGHSLLDNLTQANTDFWIAVAGGFRNLSEN